MAKLLYNFLCPFVFQYVCRSVSQQRLGWNAIFSAPNWDRVLIFGSEATLKLLMSVCPSDWGGYAVFLAPNWDRVNFFCANFSHIWSSIYSINILSVGLSVRLYWQNCKDMEMRFSPSLISPIFCEYSPHLWVSIL